MSKTLWARNPLNCVREAFEVGLTRFAWDANFLKAKGVFPSSWILDNAGVSSGYESLIVRSNGASLYIDQQRDPIANFPVWWGNESIDLLEEILSDPNYIDESLPKKHQARANQEQRVIISDLPDMRLTPSRRLMFVLDELQKAYPHVAFHIHGSYTWRMLFGLSFQHVDFEFFDGAKKGMVFLPNGRSIQQLNKSTNQLIPHAKWVELCGHKITSLEKPRERCLYQMRSALWAAEYYQSNVDFRTRGVEVDPDNGPRLDAGEAPTRSPYINASPVEGDKYLCDVCSLQNKCTFFRSGGVCSIPDAEPARLATYFNTRNAESIVEGLGTLLATHSHRLERAVDEEAKFGGQNGPLDPEVTKLINSMFDRGVELAKLLNPSLRAPKGRPPDVRVGVQIGSSAGELVNSTPQAQVAAVIAELEASGIARDDITPELIAGVFEQAAGRADAIDVPSLVAPD